MLMMMKSRSMCILLLFVTWIFKLEIMIFLLKVSGSVMKNLIIVLSFEELLFMPFEYFTVDLCS